MPAGGRPQDFGLTYHDKDNSNKTPLCIHRAPLGTHERFIGFLIESRVCGTGNFPLWLAPDQVRVITLNDDEALLNYAKPIVAELRANMVCVDADFSATPPSPERGALLRPFPVVLQRRRLAKQCFALHLASTGTGIIFESAKTFEVNWRDQTSPDVSRPGRRPS